MNTTEQQAPRIALGPVVYYWTAEQLRDFYAGIAKTPVDIVYLGETVCSKRRALRLEEWIEIGETLSAAGKQVVLSSLALIEAESELKALRRLCANRSFLIEANDMAAVQLLAGHTAFVGGPFLNIYNPRSLAVLAREGLQRWVMPVELSGQALDALLAARPAGVETEVFAFGRLPLALSARCFTARHHRLSKDDCQMRCLADPDGILVRTREQADFLNLNGIQTQSAQTHSLLPHLTDMRARGVEVLRISPQSRGTERIVQAFAEVRNGARDPGQANAALADCMPCGPCDGYWTGGAGLTWSGAV